MDEIYLSKCSHCETGEDSKYFYRKVVLSEKCGNKTVDAVAISCPYCHRTISIIPSHLFFHRD